MGLREVAENDLNFTLEDGAFGFGWPITVTDPDGLSAQVYGQHSDIAFQIDPNTGEAVSGRVIEIAIRMKSLTDAGFTSFPVNQSDTSKKPWIFDVDDINGVSHKLTVKQSNPDRMLGVITCQCEIYKA